jgi:hypothetical protein
MGIVPFRATLSRYCDVKKMTVQMLTLQGNTNRIVDRGKMTDVAIMVGEEQKRPNSGDCPQSPYHVKTTRVKNQSHRP